MFKLTCSAVLLSSCSDDLNAADVFVCSVNDEAAQFEIDAASFLSVDFTPDRFKPLFGKGSVRFQLADQSATLDFSLSKDNLQQVWHDKEELRILFHDETSFKYDTVHGDDVTLEIITSSKSGKLYRGSYKLRLQQSGLKSNLVFEGKVACEKIFRYHQ